jgi:metal-sulfur cluster biosynthetic enzyme
VVTTTTEELGAVRDALSQVYDPELGLDIVSLGLVFDLRAEVDTIVIERTLSTPGCRVSQIRADHAAHAAADALGPGGPARIDLRVVWDPPWTPERLTADAASRLGFSRR